MLYASRAVVLRTVRYGETSLIVDMYTEQKGHQTLIINSVRKAKSATPPAYLQLLSLVDIVAYHQEQRKIHRVKEVRLEHPWQSIPFDMRKSSVITCAAEICAKCINTADPHQELFRFLHDSLLGYDHPDRYDRDFFIRFLVELSSYLGFGFDIPEDVGSARFFDLLEGHIVDDAPGHHYLMSIEDVYALQLILEAGPDRQAEVRHEVRTRLVDQLILYYQLHVESLHEVNSIRILRELF